MPRFSKSVKRLKNSLATKIVLQDTVIKRLIDLSKEMRIRYWEQGEKLMINPSSPGLRNEKLVGANQWALSITIN